MSVLKLKEDLIAASEKYLYVTEERDKEEDTIILDEISQHEMIDGMECLREIWIEDSGTITIYKFTAGYADREKYRHVRKFNITADKLKKAYCNLNK